MIETFIEEGTIGQQLIPALTPNYILTQLRSLSLLTHHLHKNTTEIQQRFIDVLSRVPAKTDRPGYIYGFRKKSKYNSQDSKYEIKLGRTSKQIPQYRIMEWQKTDMEEYVQIFTARSEFNFKLQLLVHLLFAYARKTLIINGKKRIEWFQFAQKVATGAIASQLNLLMEHLHEKYIDKLQHLQTNNSEVDYDSLIKNIMKKFITHQQESSVAIFGLPKTGKSLFRSILLENQLTVVERENRLQIVTKERQKRDNLFVEISTMPSSIDSINKLQYYFTKCLELCHSQLRPVLVVKQSDIQSSAMIGVIHALDLLQKYAKVGDGLLIVVNKSSTSFSKSDILEIIQQNEKLISKRHQAILRNSEYVVVQTAQSQGVLLSKEESLRIRNQLFNYSQSRRQKFLQVQPKLQQDILHLCYQIIQRSYQVLQQLYAKSFRKKYLQFVEEQDQVEFINITRTLLHQIRAPQKQTLQSIFKQITKITSHLELNQTVQVQTYLYIFCEMCCNKTMLRSNIFADLLQAFNEKMANITDSYNQKLDVNLQSLRQSIRGYIHADNRQFVPLLKQIMQASDLAETINIMKQIAHKQKQETKQQVKCLNQCLTGLLQTIQQIVRFSAQGLRFNSVEGRIREAIYFGFKKQ